MNEIREIIKAISVEKIESHIRNLEGIRHPVFASEALEKAADYIWDCLESYGLAVSAHYFTEDNRQYRNIIGLHPGTKQPGLKLSRQKHEPFHKATLWAGFLTATL